MVFFGKKEQTEKIINKTDLVTALRSRRLIRSRWLDICCDSIKALSYRDVLELFLYLSPVSDWKWIDVMSRSSSRLSMRTNLYNLLRDYLSWLIIYSKTSSEVKGLFTIPAVQRNHSGKESVLFLRTDHRFNLKSGGSVGHLKGVIGNLRASGYVTKVVSTDYLPGIEDNEDFYVCEPLYNVGRNIPNIPEVLYNIQLFDWINRHWQELSPTVLYQRYSLGNYAGVLLKHKYGVPYICEYNGPLMWVARHWGGRRLLHENLLSQIELLNLHAADVVVVVSKALKDNLIIRGIEADKILVNPNGVDPDGYSPVIDGVEVRRRYEFDNKVIIGFIGTFGEWHGAEVLAEAFGCLLKKFPEYRHYVRLFMIGDGPRTPLVEESIKRFNMRNECTLTGLIPQEQGPGYLAACDILASPHIPNPDGTPFFGSPTKLFEYMAMGKGIVASALDQIGDILKHNKTAWMVRPGNIEDLTSGLRTLIDDRRLRERLGAAARRQVIEEFTWEKHTMRIMNKFNEIWRDTNET
jgi:glycosyltransferase involved in cell wall biosynthesis